MKNYLPVLPPQIEGYCSLCSQPGTVYRVIGTISDDSNYYYCLSCIYNTIQNYFSLVNCDRCLSLTVKTYAFRSDSLLSKQKHVCFLCFRDLTNFDKHLLARRKFKKEIRALQKLVNKEVKKNAT